MSRQITSTQAVRVRAKTSGPDTLCVGVRHRWKGLTVTPQSYVSYPTDLGLRSGGDGRSRSPLSKVENFGVARVDVLPLLLLGTRDSNTLLISSGVHTNLVIHNNDISGGLPPYGK